MTERLVLGATLFVVIGSATAQDGELTWKRYGNDSGRFSIMLPGSPKSRTQQTDSPLGKLTVHSLTVEPSPKMAFLVSWNDYPDSVSNEAPQDVLSRVRDGNNQFLKGTVVIDQKTTVGKEKYPGRSIVIEFPYQGETMCYRANVILVETRLYQIVMIGPKGSIDTDEAEDYFRSLKLIPKKETAP